MLCMCSQSCFLPELRVRSETWYSLGVLLKCGILASLLEYGDTIHSSSLSASMQLRVRSQNVVRRSLTLK